MREHSQTTPRRRHRGPKQPLPNSEQRGRNESPYYTIDNTEDIYGTTLSAAQRRYVDPWDLENYDYVRKKISSPNSYCETSLSPSPQIVDTDVDNEDLSPYYEFNERRHMSPARRQYDLTMSRRLSATMPRNVGARRASHFDCNYECCCAVPAPLVPTRRPSRFYEDIDTCAECVFPMPDVLHDELDVDVNVYTGYGGFSSASSSTEPHSSIGEDYSTLRRSSKIAANGGILRKTSPPKFDFPGPPSHPPSSYDYCDPYSTLPYCSIPPAASDCYECFSQAQKQQCALLYAASGAGGAQSLYGSPSLIYGRHGFSSGAGTIYESTTLGRRPSSSLYSGIYTNKFGLSKKGLLQIDYSCSWNDLNRIMGRNY